MTWHSAYREVTPSAVILAILIGVIMNPAITCAGLKIGFTTGGSVIAAVLGFGILHRGSVFETNIFQKPLPLKIQLPVTHCWWPANRARRISTTRRRAFP